MAKKKPKTPSYPPNSAAGRLKKQMDVALDQRKLRKQRRKK